jgi:hypothetical protein
MDFPGGGGVDSALRGSGGLPRWAGWMGRAAGGLDRPWAASAGGWPGARKGGSATAAGRLVCSEAPWGGAGPSCWARRGECQTSGCWCRCCPCRCCERQAAADNGRGPLRPEGRTRSAKERAEQRTGKGSTVWRCRWRRRRRATARGGAQGVRTPPFCRPAKRRLQNCSSKRWVWSQSVGEAGRKHDRERPGESHAQPSSHGLPRRQVPTSTRASLTPIPSSPGWRAARRRRLRRIRTQVDPGGFRGRCRSCNARGQGALHGKVERHARTCTDAGSAVRKRGAAAVAARSAGAGHAGDVGVEGRYACARWVAKFHQPSWAVAGAQSKPWRVQGSLVLGAGGTRRGLPVALSGVVGLGWWGWLCGGRAAVGRLLRY